MWHLYNEEARRAVFHAQEIAKRLGSRETVPEALLLRLTVRLPVRWGLRRLREVRCRVSAEHLLLGLLTEPDSVARRALALAGAPPDDLRAEVEGGLTVLEEPVKEPGCDDMTLAPSAKRAVGCAVREAHGLGQYHIDHIGSEHLLLGVASERGIVRRSLASRGVGLHELRRAVRDAMATA